MSNNSKFKKWQIWIEQIKKDTETLLINRAIHERYLGIVRNNPEIQSPSDFHEWTIKNYGSFMVMAIRRQLDSDKGVISLKRLLEDLRDNPELLTKKWFRTLYSGMGEKFPITPEDFADSDFEQYAGKFNHFDAQIAAKDLLEMEDLGKNIKRFANKKIAHNTKVEMGITFKEINEFVEQFEKIVIKYILLFTASGYDSLTPVWQYDWEEIFTKPWIKSND